MEKYIGIIPARYASSRFPGKLLANLFGKPVLWHTYQSAMKFNQWEDLLVATDDDRISQSCKENGIPVIMTSSNHVDCIDRAAEVALSVSGDKYIIIQGDEPFFDSRVLYVDLTPPIVNFYTAVSDPSEIIDPDVVKVVVSRSLKAIYFSRFSIPYTQDRTRRSDDPISVDKQLGIYCFSLESLIHFQKLGMSYLEGVEGIGLLRLLENDVDIDMRYSQFDSFSVDTKSDLEKIKRKFSGLTREQG